MQCPLQFSIGWYNEKKWKAEYSFQLNTSEHCKVKQLVLLPVLQLHIDINGSRVCCRWWQWDAQMGLYWLQLVTFDCCTICTLHTVHWTHMLVWGAQYNAHGLRCWEKPQAVAHLLILLFIWLDTVHKMHVSYNVVDTEYAHYALCSAIWCKEKPQSVALGDRRDGWRRQRRHHLLFSSSLSYLSSLPSLSPL